MWDRKPVLMQEEEPLNLFIWVALKHTPFFFFHHSCLFQHLENWMWINSHGVSPPQPTFPPAASAASQAVLHVAPRLVCSGHAAEENSAWAALRGWVSYILTVVLIAVSALGRSVAALLLGMTTLPWQGGLKKLPVPNPEPLEVSDNRFHS